MVGFWLTWVNINNLYIFWVQMGEREGGKEGGELDVNWGDGDGGAHFL